VNGLERKSETRVGVSNRVINPRYCRGVHLAISFCTCYTLRPTAFDSCVRNRPGSVTPLLGYRDFRGLQRDVGNEVRKGSVKGDDEIKHAKEAGNMDAQQNFG
jgi:hypothetical protein